MKYLIDGYNVIFECGLHTRNVNAASLTKARDRLLRTICHGLNADDVARTTVVFDAQKIPLSGQREQQRFGAIQVLFSINYPDADAQVIELINCHSVPKRLVVVSSDHQIQKMALRRKAMPIDSGPWYDMLVDGKLKPQKQPHQPENNLQHNKDFSAEEIAALATDVDDIEYQDANPQPAPPIPNADAPAPDEQQSIDEIDNENDNPFPSDILDDADLDDLFDF